MNRHKVLFLPYNKEITVDDGESLIRAAMEASVHVNASCGGEGVCGKCRVIIEEGSVEDGVSERLDSDDLEKGYRLACLSKIKGDITVRIPTESAIDESALNLTSTPRKTAHIKHINFEELKEQGLFVPPVEKLYLEMPEPDAQDHEPDVTRIINFLSQVYDEHQLQLNLPVIRKIPDVLRENDFKVTVTLERPVREGGKTRIINIQPGDTSAKNYAIALDIGTTTVYGQVVDLGTGETLSQSGTFNGQISYGEDVINRIVFAEKPGGLDKISEVVIETINKIIGKTIKKSGVERENISAITIAGNTTMTQLMLKINPSYIRRAPYVPAATLYPPVRASDLNMDLEKHVTALVYPQVSSYVGGDIVAGVMGSGMYRSEELTLFIDIGTNAEVVVGNKDWLACAACSAGPAFEGGGITFGMRAAKGAIEDFSIDPFTYEPMIMTIANVKPKGICGSGLITMVAVLFETGVINNQGKYNRDLKTERLRETNDIWEYVISFEEETQIDRDITLTEIDIENLIRAKGAIYSGCQTLLEEVGLGINDLDRIILAGGFGSFIDLEKAMIIGLLPEIDTEKVTFIGNGSLMGAKMSSLTNHIRQEVGMVTQKMTNFELSETHSYMDRLVASMFLPHTDINLFPKLKERLENRNN